MRNRSRIATQARHECRVRASVSQRSETKSVDKKPSDSPRVLPGVLEVVEVLAPRPAAQARVPQGRARLRGAFSAPARGLQRFARAVRVERARRRGRGRTPRRRERASFSRRLWSCLSPPCRGGAAGGAFFAAIAVAFLVMRTTGAVRASGRTRPRPSARASAPPKPFFSSPGDEPRFAAEPALAERAELALGGLRLAQRRLRDLARCARSLIVWRHRSAQTRTAVRRVFRGGASRARARAGAARVRPPPPPIPTGVRLAETRGFAAGRGSRVAGDEAGRRSRRAEHHATRAGGRRPVEPAGDSRRAPAGAAGAQRLRARGTPPLDRASCRIRRDGGGAAESPGASRGRSRRRRGGARTRAAPV